VQEAKAAKVLRFAYLGSEENAIDILTKPLCNEKFHYLVKKWLFRTPQCYLFKILKTNEKNPIKTLKKFNNDLGISKRTGNLFV
jgi:hypothetical protein